VSDDVKAILGSEPRLYKNSIDLGRDDTIAN